jgi:hypothetical protein
MERTMRLRNVVLAGYVEYCVLQIGLSTYFLYRLLGVSTFAGIALMVVMSPINGLITRRLRVIAKAVMKVKDERINKTNEVVNAIKLVKCNGWEDIFRDGVMRARKAELAQLTQYILFRTLIMVFFTAVRVLTPALTFALVPL